MIYYLEVSVYSNIENTLTYKLESDSEPKKGIRVVVPLGNKVTTGIVLNILNKKDIKIPEEKIKFIKEIIDEEPVLTDELIKLGRWISDYYLTAPGIVFSTMLSALHKIKSNKIIKFIKDDEKIKGLSRQIIDFIKSREEVTIKTIIRHLKVNNVYSVLDNLEEKGLIEIKEEEKTYGIKKKVSEFEKNLYMDDGVFELTDEQKAAFVKIKENIESGKYKTFLLLGITGSGKTEIYIKAAEEVIKNGKKAIILVPEIFLTPQILERFKRVFGEKIAIYHSALKSSERLAEWKKMREGKVDIVIGTRSAVFAPFEKIGLLVVDEEFDTSYKQENEPGYNARDVAVYRGFINDATVILGSATPSLESYYNAKSGKYEILKLTERVKGRKMPDIKIIDLKLEKDWQKKFLSNTFLKEMENALENGEQVILFLNRRGFSSYILCYKCGFVLKCKNCDIPLIYHKQENILKCHYCDDKGEPVNICPFCKNVLFYRGLGTQKIEDIIIKMFPDKKIARIDIDTMKGKKQYFQMYKKIKEKEIDIMIGTQMIAKGFDLPEVTFVGVVNIDNVLNLPDFKSEERVFQLLIQVAGRCGRGEKEGKVVIQTFTPESLGLKFIKNYEIEKFYEKQLELRKTMNYPPYSFLTQIILQDEKKEKCEENANVVRNEIDKFLKENNITTIEILGPAEAPLAKIRNKYRYSIILKSKSRKDLNKLGKKIKSLKKYDLSIIIDPVNIL